MKINSICILGGGTSGFATASVLAKYRQTSGLKFDIKVVYSENVGTIGVGESTLFASGAPIHVKGAILYNHLVRKQKLQNKYPLILEGDKIRFLHLRQPNIFQSTAFSFITNVPKELDIRSKIDYDVQFEKSFVEPLKFITDKILWRIDDSYGTQGTLEDFF